MRSIQLPPLILTIGIILLSGVSPVGAEEDAEGLQTRLVPIEPTYEIGKPMKLRADLVNVGSTPAPYDSIGYAQYNGRLIVKGPDGKAVPYIGPWSGDQVGMTSELPSLKPGETLTVFTIDLAQTYYIDHPGQYTIQHNGEYIPKSEPVRVTIRPGRLSEADEIVGRLLKEFGPGWTVSKGLPNEAGPVRPPNGIVVVYLDEGTPSYGRGPLCIYQLRRADPAFAQPDKAMPPIEYLGEDRWGAVYARDGLQGFVNPMRAVGLLPRVRDQIKQALEISTPRLQ